MRRKGFTLIELLVVIAIIAILAAILFPVFAKAREKARQSSCASNEKQLALAVIQYTQDFDEKYPKGGTFDINTWWIDWENGWPEEIAPYLKTVNVFRCPDDNWHTPASWGAIEGMSYSINAAQVTGIGAQDRGMFGQPNNGGDKPSMTLGKVVKPAETIMICEVLNKDGLSAPDHVPNGFHEANWPITWRAGWGWAQASNGNMPDGNSTNNTAGWNASEPTYEVTGKNGNVSAPHSGGTSNFAFADGHVKAMKPYLTNPDMDNHPENNMWDALRD